MLVLQTIADGQVVPDALLLRLADVVLEQPGPRLALAVRAGGAFRYERAIELAELVILEHRRRQPLAQKVAG